jgi:hypothetical protein
MKFNSPLYFCTECKTVVTELDKLLFIEEHSSKGFCSESCIEDFYAPLITHFENLEKKTRKTLGIEEEGIHQKHDDKDLVEEVLSSPTEVWQIQNELRESIYHYIKHFKDYSAIVVCTVYNKQASFVFFKTITRSKALLEEFRRPEEDEGPTPPEELNEVPEENFSEEDFEFMQLLESKKSKLLADLLLKRKDEDISFEDFTNYESCYQECLETPDEVFESKDNEGDVFFVYIKSFIQDGANFFYIISCLKRKDMETNDEVNVFPVLAFPTNDMDLYREFRSGAKISAGPLKN